MNFKTISKIDESIYDQESFDASEYAGIDRLLKVQWGDCLFITSEDDEEVGEQYYMLEGNAEKKETADEIMLVEMDGILFAIINLDGIYAIAIDKKNLSQAVELLTD